MSREQFSVMHDLDNQVPFWLAEEMQPLQFFGPGQSAQSAENGYKNSGYGSVADSQLEMPLDEDSLMDRIAEAINYAEEISSDCHLSRCQVCGNNYRPVSENHRYESDKSPVCPSCSKFFSFPTNNQPLPRAETGLPQCYTCEPCVTEQYEFSDSGSKKFQCYVCGSEFVNSCGLQRHLRSHTGERPYVCDICNKSFAANSTFVSHKRTHTGERPYKCELCEKQFTTKSHLLTHKRTHSDERPYTCSVCYKAFSDRSSLRRHEKLHINEIRYPCKFCHESFFLQSALIEHSKVHDLELIN